MVSTLGHVPWIPPLSKLDPVSSTSPSALEDACSTSKLRGASVTRYFLVALVKWLSERGGLLGTNDVPVRPTHLHFAFFLPTSSNLLESILTFLLRLVDSSAVVPTLADDILNSQSDSRLAGWQLIAG